MRFSDCIFLHSLDEPAVPHLATFSLVFPTVTGLARPNGPEGGHGDQFERAGFDR